MRSQSRSRHFVLFAALAGSTFLAGCSGAPSAQTAEPLVATAVAQGEGGAAGEAYTGTVHARTESVLAFRVPGKIVARLVDAGAHVRAGQPLYRLDARDLGLAASAAADRVRAAQADAARTAADEARLRPLVATGAISPSTYDGARAARDAAAATLSAARAAASNASNERGYAVLVADADGIVTELLAEAGQVVAAGTPVLRLARSGAREALVAVPETALAALPKSAQAAVYGRSAPVTATLREVAGAADPLTRTFAARYVLSGAAEDAPLGATITVRLPGASSATSRVPLGALVDLGKGQGVWVIQPDRSLLFRPAQPLRLTEEEAFLPASALPPGTRVVALGGQLLRPGQKVHLIEGQVR
ncbi:MAG: efflux RND transporter periplasmic adaptor subunit [Sphingomonadales bacterium]|uniref:efflux RND transporter periplasmic adaptor subunit n=1 Tax=Novosphingobium sp. NDB2Meth1 TaxID=1892847 RepID=UPI0009308F0C|nr:efflux RND transporter periplasmic adaptor subunit [Novosphingobium sp. NDB2Meth1]MBU6393887.1 efflux RND transporter periplasmic adaptor subunit [Sphingomonadales bacterium]MBY0393929.1 efflux RND transporter periplasmic adaptor subunit [Novosphingobium sp.]